MTLPATKVSVPEHPDLPAPTAKTPSLPRLARAWWAVRIPVSLVIGRLVVGVLLAHWAMQFFPLQHLPFGIGSGGTWFGAFYRWDSVHYVSIAAHGYPLNQPDLTAFFPGYPLVVRAASDVTFGSAGLVQAGTIVSWLAFAAAAVLLYHVVAHRFGSRAAALGTALFCWYPTSLFFMSPYSESLFALEIIAVVALLDRRQFLAAAAVAAAASATSPESLALTAGLVLAAALDRRAMWKILGYAAVSVAGIAAYMVFLQVHFANAFEFASVQHAWHRSENLPFVGLFRNISALTEALVGPGPPTGSAVPTFANVRAMWLLDDAMLALAAAAAIYVAWLAWSRWATRSERAGTSHRQFPVVWVVVAAVIVLIAACTTIYPWGNTPYASTEGEARFVSIAMPLYAGLGVFLARYRSVAMVVVPAAVAVAVAFQVLYNLGYWVT